MKIAIDNNVSYNPNKFIANTRELLQEWPDSDPNIYLYDLIDIKNHKESQLNSLEHKCKLGISSVYKVVFKPSRAIYLKRLSTEEQRFSAELVNKNKRIQMIHLMI